MRTFFMVAMLSLFVHFVKAQDTIFDLSVRLVTLNGKPTLQELTKSKSISFGLYTPQNGTPKLTAWVDEEIAADGSLELISHKKHEKTKQKLGGYEANYIWSTIDDNGQLAKFSVAFHIIIDPRGDRFVLEVKRAANTHVYSGFIRVLKE